MQKAPGAKPKSAVTPPAFIIVKHQNARAYWK
jgi:hypothetical protein